MDYGYIYVKPKLEETLQLLCYIIIHISERAKDIMEKTNCEC